jgi:hypothetical protein
MSNIDCDIQIFCLFLQKRGRKFCSSLHTSDFAKTTKRVRLLHLIISLILLFCKTLLNLISFFLRFDYRILRSFKRMKKK